MMFLGFTVVTALTFMQVSAGCPTGFRKLGTGCYNFVHVAATWENAKATCQSFSSSLVSLETERETTIIRGALLAAADSTFDPWTDAYTADPYSGHWVWKTSNTPMTYTDWYQGQPDRTGSTGHAAHCMRLDGYFGYKWNDQDCSTKHQFICETGDSNTQGTAVVG